MADDHDGFREKWKSDLEREFESRGVDSSLIAAIVEERDTYDEAYSILEALADPAEEKVALMPDTQENGQEGASQNDGSDFDESTSHPSATVDEEDDKVNELLQQWKLIDVESNETENLHLTDEEGVETAKGSAEEDAEEREAKRLGVAASRGILHEDEQVVTLADEQEVTDSTAVRPSSGLAFLIHAFPSRTPVFLEEMLNNEQGHVERVIDTLSVMEMIESGLLDESDDDDHGVYLSPKNAGTDDKLLERGTGHKKISKNERRRRKEQSHTANAVLGASKGTPVKINMTDIRQGGPSVSRPQRKIVPVSGESRKAKVSDVVEDDAAMAARLAAEERIAAGLPPHEEDDAPVQDNDWLFSSSILDQLSDLLDIQSHRVRSVHNACHFNLRATTHRLVNLNCQEFPTLLSLDEAGRAPTGTAASIVDGLSVLLPSMPRTELERVFRGSKGRQDATLDLVQLIDIVDKSAVGEKSDALDPMMMARGPSAVVSRDNASEDVRGSKRGLFTFVGEEHDALPPGDVPYSQITKRASKRGVQTESRKYALEQLRAGAASISYPFHSSQIDKSAEAAAAADPRSSLFDGPRRNETQSEAERLAQEYRAIASEYQTRREESLRQAAHAYRSLPGGGSSKHIRGAAAWAYADEARRLDAKARAFSLKAAQATVRHRMMTNRLASTLHENSNSNGSSRLATSSLSSTRRHSPDIVDLHGLTVHESLSITKEALSAWWSRSSSGTVHPLHIITGVGRHSRGHVAVIRPAILKMLQRDGWISEERSEGQIVVKGLR